MEDLVLDFRSHGALVEVDHSAVSVVISMGLGLKLQIVANRPIAGGGRRHTVSRLRGDFAQLSTVKPMQ